MLLRSTAAMGCMVGGAALCIVVGLLAPVELEHLFDGSSSPRHTPFVVARGPGLARDVGGETLISFRCAHTNCATAVRFEGNASSWADRRWVILTSQDWSTSRLDKPWGVGDPGAFRVDVADATQSPARAWPLAPFVAVAGLGVLGGSLGIALWVGRSLFESCVVTLGGLGGFVFVLGVQASGRLEAIVPIALAILASLVVGSVLFVIGRRSAPLRTASLVVLLFSLASFVSELMLPNYFPACCSL